MPSATPLPVAIRFPNASKAVLPTPSSPSWPAHPNQRRLAPARKSKTKNRWRSIRSSREAEAAPSRQGRPQTNDNPTTEELRRFEEDIVVGKPGRRGGRRGPGRIRERGEIPGTL